MMTLINHFSTHTCIGQKTIFYLIIVSSIFLHSVQQKYKWLLFT